ncbi:MAG: DUF6522 family protein [Albidovulum sp.]
MTQIEVTQDGFVVDAAVIAEAFRLVPKDIQALMRRGDITSISETGVGEDAGRARLTFHYRDRALRLVVDQTGAILKRASFPAPARNPAAAKPGGVSR